MIIRFLAFLVIACSVGAAFAELPPSAYEAMQAKAPEVLKIEVLRVDIAPGNTEAEQKISLVAAVSKVDRTSAGIAVNDIININYVVTERPKGWAGPGQVPIPKVKDETIAYLAPAGPGEFAPAAGRMTFSTF